MGATATPPAATPHAPTTLNWHQVSGEDVLARVAATSSGLSTGEAAIRLAKDGPNVLTMAGRRSAWRILGGQFNSILVWLLIAAAVVSGLIGDPIDAIAIIAIVMLNAAVGFYQELSAEKSIFALQALTAPMAKVRRDGRTTLVPSANVVRGDILTLEAGDLVASDARVLAASSLTCIEAALTGESETVAKGSAALPRGDTPLGDRGNMLFMGTSVATGTGEAVVVATAMHTELGQIAALLGTSGEKQVTPLQRQLDAFGRILIVAALAIVALLFALGLLRGTAPFELLMTSISLAIAAVPEGLPAVVTVALSLGVHRMAQRRALVRKLAAVETLGATTVICTDKTGTLTVGEMTVRKFFIAGQAYEVTGEGYSPTGEVRFDGERVTAVDTAALEALATVIVGCNNAHVAQRDGRWQSIGDPTEGALLVAGMKAGADRARLERDMPKVKEFPFDSDRKRSAVVRRMADGHLRAFVNGAPGPLLALCSQIWTAAGPRPLLDEDRRLISDFMESMAAQALRVLGSAYHDLGARSSDALTHEKVEADMVFVGLTGMHDPPRAEARDAIATCRAAGIRVVMITGDHPQTATAIANGLNIESAGAAVTGAEIDGMSEEELRRRAPEVGVYARVTAEHKLRIVRALRANGDTVAMTGDGVNDAPAIKGADIGIAMGRSGTEVTKQTADIIITDDNFATIVAAVEEGRGIYENIRKTLAYLLAGNTGELLLMVACVATGLPFPLLPIHLLWINLVTDGIPALCLATDPIDPAVMSRAPRRRSSTMTDRSFLQSTIVTGVLTAAVALGAFLFVLRDGPVELARTYAFAVLVFAELLRSFGARSERAPVWRIALRTNLRLVIVVGVSIGVQMVIVSGPALGHLLKATHIPLAGTITLLALGAVPSLVLELLKVRRPIARIAA